MRERKDRRAARAAAALAVAACAALGAGRAGAQGAPRGVRVNDVIIPGEAVACEERYIVNQRQMMHPMNAKAREAAKSEAEDRVVVWEIVRQKLRAAGKEVSEAEIDLAVAEDRSRIGEIFPKYVGILGQDEASYRRRKACVLGFRRYSTEFIAPAQQVTDEEIRAFFDESGKYHQQAGSRIDFIQVHGTGAAHGTASRAELAEAAAKAHRLVREGALLEDAAKAVGSGRVAARVGERFYLPGEVPAYDEALRTLKPGEAAEPVAMGSGWVVLRLVETVPEKDMSFEEARDAIRALLISRKTNVATEEHIKGLKGKADVQVLDGKGATTF